MNNLENLSGGFGLPFIGEAHEAFFYKQQFYLDRYYKYKNIFCTRILDKNAVVLFSPDACHAVLENKDGVFTSREGWSVLEEFLGYGILLQDGVTHKDSRKLIGKAFSELSRDLLFETINNYARIILHEWCDNSQVFLFSSLRKFTFRVIFILVFGMSNEVEIHYLERLFSQLVDGQLDIFRINSSQTSYGRAIEARSKIYKHIFKKLDDAYRKDEASSTILSVILNNNNQDFISQPLDQNEITVQIIQILFAGYETSATLIFWAIFSICKNPDVYTVLREEINSAPTNLKYSILSLKYLEHCLLETERLFPPVYAIPRGLTKDFSIHGYCFPKSWNIIVSPLLTHRLESIFIEPNKFMPSRFEDENLHKYLFGFGAGQHKCLGQKIAKLEASILMNLLLQVGTFRISPNISFDQATLSSHSFLKKLFISLEPHQS